MVPVSKYEPILGAIAFERPLLSGLVYPFDWDSCGYARGGWRFLGCAVLFDQPTFLGVVIAYRALGVIV
jgi:hypothetical protein